MTRPPAPPPLPPTGPLVVPPFRTVMVDMLPSSAYKRGIIAGAGRFCRERPRLRLSQISIEWELTGDKAKVDGVIALVAADDPADPATRFQSPVVNVSCVHHPVPFPTVTVDNRAVGRLAAEHLLTQGYLHFACHMESRVYFSVERTAGFREKVEAAGRGCSVFDTAPAGNFEDTPEGLRRATARWLTDLPKPLGLFTHSDTRAATLIEICKEAGLAVPEQVGVIGVDHDEMLLMTLTPTLTSVDVAADVIGYRALELLIDLLDGNPPPTRPVLVPPRGVVQHRSTEPAYLDDEVLGQAMDFIREHATDPIDVSDVLKIVLVSRRSLERRFRERLNRSPADEIRRVQMDHAKRLLLENNQKPSGIAHAVGYSTFRNFATAFRREVGVSPMKYARDFLARR